MDSEESDAGFRPEDMRADLADYLADLAHYRMPFGRYRNRYLYDLPLEYLQWFQQKGGFPAGRLGELMAFVCHTKTDGAELIFGPLRKARGPRPPKKGRSRGPF
jgi:uncharacterized protein (DUF3820 family)